MKLQPFGEEQKTFALKLDGPVTSDGTFTGYLSVYNVVDLGKDMVEAGAFTKTINDNNGKVPMFINHDPDKTVGMLTLSDDTYGLKVSGEMYIDSNPLAAQWHATAKRFSEAGRSMGLSIGYTAVKTKMEGGIRKLKELKLYEGSLTPIPMCQEALVTTVKSLGSPQSEFAGELARVQLLAMHCSLIEALEASLSNVRRMPDGTAEKLQVATNSIDDFKTDYLGYLPNLLDITSGESHADEKVGRRISSSTRSELAAVIAAGLEAIQKLQALLEGDAADTVEETAAASTPEPKAAEPPAEPELLHSWGKAFAEAVKETLGVAN